MTDADVDGAHIAALLMTFFFREMPQLIADGHLYLAQPPLFRLSAGGEVAYARDEADRDRLIAARFNGKKVELSRFKGLGEMSARQLKETTMDPATRKLERVEIDPQTGELAGDLVERLMGRRPELRLAFIQANALAAGDLDV
jgi:topoisomerase-4 subunit B